MSAAIDIEFTRLKDIREKELKLRPVARKVEDIPVSYDLISTEWLTRILCRDAPGAEVVSHELDAVDEGTSNRRRIFVTYNDAGARAGLPASIFCKASQTYECRCVIGLMGAAGMEVDFYNNVRPRLNIEAPSALFANYDPETLNSIIVLKDLQDSVNFCQEDTILTFEQAKGQMKILAEIHGYFTANAKELHSLKSVAVEQYFDKMCLVMNWGAACQRGFLRAQTVIPPRLFDRIGDIWPKTVKAWHRHGDLPRTFIHSDVHLRNWYILGNGEMGLSDWLNFKGHWSRDLAYTISTALPVETRRAWENDLIEYYLEKLEIAGGHRVGFDEAHKLYRQQLFTALSYWTGTLTPEPGMPDFQPSGASMEFIKRITHAIDDLDGLAAI